MVKTYRGITTGAYQSEFVDCATGARWEFYSDLRWHAEGSKVPVPATDSTARYVVEIVGELMPEWVARQRNSKYTRVLQIYRLVSVRPALDGVCPNERSVRQLGLDLDLGFARWLEDLERSPTHH